MLNLAFVATLFSLLPSFLGVTVETDLFGPSFKRHREDIPVIWSDGEIRLQGGKVVISVGEKSTLMVFSKDEITEKTIIHKFVCYVKETIELTEANIHVAITTEKEEVDSGKVIDKLSSVGDVVTLKIIELEPMMIGVVDPEKSIKTKDVFKSAESPHVSDLENEGHSGELIDKCGSFGNVVTQSNSVDYFDEYIPEPSNYIETNIVVKETEEVPEQDDLSNGIVNMEVQSQPSENNPKGEQFKFDGYNEPIIYGSKGLVEWPQFVNSVTGKIFQPRTTKKREPFTGKYRIPDDTKLLILNEGDSRKYYKNITKESKVWYLKKNEKVFYPCIVHRFSLSNRNPTLKCINHEPQLVPKVSWDDVFPIESANLIKGLGEFKIQPEDINWDDMLRRKRTDITLSEKREKQETYKTLPRKRKNTLNEQFIWKERSIGNIDESEVRNLQSNNNSFSNDEFFRVGDRLDHVKAPSSPLVFLSFLKNGKQVSVLNAATGKIVHVLKKFVKLSEKPQIPIETKISEDMQLKIILPKSHVLYRNSDGTYYPCVVTRFAYSNDDPIQIKCNTLGVLTPNWNDIFPIEALPILPGPVNIHGFEDSQAVTLDALEKFIITGIILNSTDFPQISDLDLDCRLASENAITVDPETDDLLDFINDDITLKMNDISRLHTLDTLIHETEGNNDQVSLGNGPVKAEVQRHILRECFKGEQFKFDGFDEPFIYASNGLVERPQVVSSLTGKTFQPTTRKWWPLTGEDRIPDDTKLLIVNEENSVKYYKNITLGSKVWYLKSNEKVFYPCIVKAFSKTNPKPTLQCINHEPQLVPKVSWDDVFPIESANLIKGMGEFMIQRDNIDWDDLSNKKKTEITIFEKRKSSKALPQKRKNDPSTNNEDTHLKEQCIDGEAGVNNTFQNNNTIISNDEFFRVSDQLVHLKEDLPPLIFLSVHLKGKEIVAVDSATGNVRRLRRDFVKLSAKPIIPIKTKISKDLKLKIIHSKSHILYRNSDGTYYTGVVTSLMHGNPIKIKCDTLGVIFPEWDDIFPIEAFSALPKPLKIHGFENGTTVTLYVLEEFIKTGKILNSTDIPHLLDTEMESLLPSENNDIGTDTLIGETKGNNDPGDADVQSQPSGKNPNREQYKVGKFVEPMIYASKGFVGRPCFISTLTGKIHPLIVNKLEPFTGDKRIPDDTKMLIVNEGDSKKYYKNMILGSRVWYLHRDEKVFYPCIVQNFSIRFKKPTLKCIGHEPKTVSNVSWDDIFPIESTDLIKGMGEFMIQRKDIKWSNLSKQKK